MGRIIKVNKKFLSLSSDRKTLPIISIGSDARPALSQDIQDFQTLLSKAFEDENVKSIVVPFPVNITYLRNEEPAE